MFVKKVRSREVKGASRVVAGIAASVVVFAGLVSACSSDEFEGCSATRTCPPGAAGTAGGSGMSGSGGHGGSAGSVAEGARGGSAGVGIAGEAGAGGEGGGSFADGGRSGNAPVGGAAGSGISAGAGAGGEPAAPDCERDLDCSDDNFCSGEERCVDGVCVTGEAPCENAEPDACEVTCDETLDVCVTVARDDDADGFASARCTLSPGDDCDDVDGGIHPQALEACDGIDNDCDGDLDLADGLALGGTTRIAANYGEFADVAWSTAAATFGIVYSINADRIIQFGVLANDGSIFDAANPLAPQTSGTRYGAPVIAWSSSASKYAVAFPVENVLRVGTVSASGTLENADDVAGTWEYDLAASDTGAEWTLAMGQSGDALRLNRYREDAGVVSGVSLDASPSDHHPRVAANGAHAGLVHSVGTSVEWEHVEGSLQPSGGRELCTNCQGADVEAFAGGYALSWMTVEGVNFVRKDPQGNTLCGPTVVAFHPSEPHSGEVSLAAGDGHVIALATHVLGNVAVLRFDEECRVLGQGDLTDATQWPLAQRPRLALGGGRVALAWNVGALSLNTRVMSELLCE